MIIHDKIVQTAQYDATSEQYSTRAVCTYISRSGLVHNNKKKFLIK